MRVRTARELERERAVENGEVDRQETLCAKASVLPVIAWISILATFFVAVLPLFPVGHFKSVTDFYWYLFLVLAFLTASFCLLPALLSAGKIYVDDSGLTHLSRRGSFFLDWRDIQAVRIYGATIVFLGKNGGAIVWASPKNWEGAQSRAAWVRVQDEMENNQVTITTGSHPFSPVLLSRSG